MEYLEQNFAEEYSGLENSLWEVISDKGSINSSENSACATNSIGSGTSSISSNSSTLDDSLFDILFTCPETPNSILLKPEEPQNQPESQSLNKRKQQSVSSSNNLRVTKKPKLQRILTSTASSVVVKIEPAEEYEEESNQSCFQQSPYLVSQNNNYNVKQQIPNGSTSNHEVRENKRKQRMIRNRESASLSRQRRKAHLEGIEKQNASLENENRQLKHTNVQLQQQIQYLQRELLQLRPLVATFTK